MKKALLLITLTLALASCDDTVNGSISRLYFENSELNPPNEDVGMFVNWTQGDKTVIQFLFSHPEEREIADDELSEIFWIELPIDLNEFSFRQGVDLPQPELEFYYTRSCFCFFERFEFSRAELSGEKIAPNQWRVSFDIVAIADGQEFPFSDSGIYTLSTRE